jgi:GNAT superfamily N-acetyltransferase
VDIEVKKLTADLFDDWMNYFDNTANLPDKEWAGCYCMAPQWSAKLQKEREWEYSKEGAAHNREYAKEYITKGILQGYLAYCGGKVVGWCNANDKQSYDSIFFLLPWDESEKGKKIKAVACFHVAQNLRNKGIAKAVDDTGLIEVKNIVKKAKEIFDKAKMRGNNYLSKLLKDDEIEILAECDREFGELNDICYDTLEEYAEKNKNDNIYT